MYSNAYDSYWLVDVELTRRLYGTDLRETNPYATLRLYQLTFVLGDAIYELPDQVGSSSWAISYSCLHGVGLKKYAS